MRNLKEDVVVHKSKETYLEKEKILDFRYYFKSFIIFNLGGSADTPSGIEEDFYKSSFIVFTN